MYNEVENAIHTVHLHSHPHDGLGGGLCQGSFGFGLFGHFAVVAAPIGRHRHLIIIDVVKLQKPA